MGTSTLYFDIMHVSLIYYNIIRLVSSSASTKNGGVVFVSLYFIVFIGGLFASLNITLLGINYSLLQGVSLLGYCMFPLLISACLIRFIPLYRIIKLLILAVSTAWCCLSSLSFISSLVEKKRKFLSLYPIILYYLFLSWFVLTM